MSVLHKIRIEAEGKKPQCVYRKIYELQVEGSPNQPRRRTHRALYCYQKPEMIVYLEDGKWVSYGEVAD